MNSESLTNAQLQEIAGLQEKLDALRCQLGVAGRGAVLYRSELGYGDDEFIVVEADGFGGAVLRRGEGVYPTDFQTQSELEYATEVDAVRGAEALRDNLLT